ncbi:uncharacterized protein METZ01_LOCUS243063 [marine metagenome]|uniref:Uncharacterized protein n=1 Tax=marine metagenome TaxID=408172 RepID=A0A382HSS1_9ZZZZ
MILKVTSAKPGMNDRDQLRLLDFCGSQSSAVMHSTGILTGLLDDYYLSFPLIAK